MCEFSMCMVDNKRGHFSSCGVSILFGNLSTNCHFHLNVDCLLLNLVF